MKIYLTIILLCIYCGANSQNFGCFTKPTGYWDYSNTYSNVRINADSLFWIQYSISIAKNGHYKAMWNKYQIKMEGNLSDGIRNGEWKMFSKDQNAFYQGNYTDGKKNGVWRYYEISQNDTILMNKGLYINDLKEGEHIVYSKDTVIYSITHYKSGKLDGEQIVFKLKNENKKYIDRIRNYKDDLQNGIEKEYKFNKKGNLYLFQQTEYINDSIKGKRIFFSSNGDTLEIDDYSNGNYYGSLDFKQIEIGTQLLLSHKKNNGITIDIKYSDEGDTVKIEQAQDIYSCCKIFKIDTLDNRWKIDRRINYKQRKVDGSYQKYYSNGQLAFEIIFKEGFLYTAVSCFTLDGRKLDAGTLKEGNGTLNFYYPEGKIKSSFFYDNSMCKGRLFSYFRNGNIEIEGNMYVNKASILEFSEYSNEDNDINLYYLDKNLNANITVYYENQIKKSIIKYDTISKINAFEFFYENGNTKTRLYLLNNMCIGQYISYYKNGFIKTIGKYIITNDGKSVKDSIWNYYLNHGIIKASINYNKNKKSGLSKYYDNTGQLRRVEVIESNGATYNIFDGDTVNLMDKNKLKQGKWISLPNSSYDDTICNDIPNSIEFYKNSKPVGIWENSTRFYGYCSTKIKEKYCWIDSTLASYNSYNKNNMLIEEGEIIGPKIKFGLWKEYDCEEGYLKSEGQYSFSRKVGKWKVYKKNGKVKKIIDCDKYPIYKRLFPTYHK